jgi:serine/threonine-protein kinase
MSDVPQSVPLLGSGDKVLVDVVAEITDRLHAGEAVDLQAVIARYPERAEQLRRLLPALELLDQLGSSAGADKPSRPTGKERPDEMTGVLGDFRILREVGRGGMGVVYEARQMSLNRRVALKVLPFAANLDPRQLKRFQNEAQAAASLEHPHIVPVYAVGCERGVHYYAMKFIEGLSLAETIRAQTQERAALTAKPTPESPHRPAVPAVSDPVTHLHVGPPPDQVEDVQTGDLLPATATTQEVSVKQPTVPSLHGKRYFQNVARLAIQAAEALEHAHALGIIHRDIKPANLMVDERGELWVTDFGLARTAAETGLTMTGDLLGTLRYMSPEQALAKHGLVDHRTDIYALGVTFYEMVTLQPAIHGKDREEMLNRIANEEPRAPRRINRAIPTDLETILLKALCKEPDGRYVSAKALADDLGRFLNYQPIRARRP